MNLRLACVLGSLVLGAIVSGPAPAAGQDGQYYPVPSRDQTLRGTKRFVLVMPIEGFGFQAAPDRETGLVWQRVPNEPRAFEWLTARSLCRTENTGGRQGWRLPSIEETVVPGARVFPEEFKLRAWCVRGGQGGHP